MNSELTQQRHYLAWRRVSFATFSHIKITMEKPERQEQELVEEVKKRKQRDRKRVIHHQLSLLLNT